MPQDMYKWVDVLNGTRLLPIDTEMGFEWIVDILKWVSMHYANTYGSESVIKNHAIVECQKILTGFQLQWPC